MGGEDGSAAVDMGSAGADTAAAPTADAGGSIDTGVETSDSAPRTETDAAESKDFSQDQRLGPSLRGTPPDDPGEASPDASQPAQEPERRESRGEKRVREVLADRARLQKRVEELERRPPQEGPAGEADPTATSHQDPGKQAPAGPIPEGQTLRYDDSGVPLKPDPNDFLDDEGEVDGFRMIDAVADYKLALRDHAQAETLREEQATKAREAYQTRETEYAKENPAFYDDLGVAESTLFSQERVPVRGEDGKFTGEFKDAAGDPRNPALMGLLGRVADPSLTHAVSLLAKSDPDRLNRMVQSGPVDTVAEMFELQREMLTGKAGYTPPRPGPVTPRAPKGPPGDVGKTMTESMVRGKDARWVADNDDAINKSINAGTFYGR